MAEDRIPSISESENIVDVFPESVRTRRWAIPVTPQIGGRDVPAALREIWANPPPSGAAGGDPVQQQYPLATGAAPRDGVERYRHLDLQTIQE